MTALVVILAVPPELWFPDMIALHEPMKNIRSTMVPQPIRQPFLLRGFLLEVEVKRVSGLVVGSMMQWVMSMGLVVMVVASACRVVGMAAEAVVVMVGYWIGYQVIALLFSLNKTIFSR